jgi:hypothetical protein
MQHASRREIQTFFTAQEFEPITGILIDTTGSAVTQLVNKGDIIRTLSTKVKKRRKTKLYQTEIMSKVG